MRGSRTTTSLGGVLAAAPAVALAACGSSGSKGGPAPSSAPSSGASRFSYNNGPSGGSMGGTLKVLAQADVPNYATFAMYDTQSYGIARLYARSLYAYASGNTSEARAAVQPDIADAMPQVSADNLTSTFTLKQGFDWNINGTGRQVTAQDAIRGLKMACNPVLPFGAPYYTESIKGMQSFCTGFGKVSQTSASAIKNYEESTPVSGLQAVDPTTLNFTLTGPTSDFLHFLALPSGSPVNIEQLNNVPDDTGFRSHIYSDGPYMITSYVAKKSIAFTRNPVWKASTDPLRKAYVNEIDFTIGGAEQTILEQIQAGTADSTFGDEPIPTTAIAGLLSSRSPEIHINPTGGTNPYLVFNTKGGSAAVRNVLVRQAINYAINKAAVSQVLGGPRVDPVINQVFSQTVIGAGWQQQDVYRTPGNSGDVAKAKQLLAQAGFAKGLTIKFSYRATGDGPKIADAVQSSLSAAGITVKLKQVPTEDYFSNYLQKPSIAASGDWDLAEPGWFPDWEGNSERSYYTPLFDGRQYGPGSTNYGDYDNAAVNTAADAALKETNPATAAADWNKIDGQIMADAPWVPLVEQNQVNFVSSRVKNYQFYYPGSGLDLANAAVQ